MFKLYILYTLYKLYKLYSSKQDMINIMRKAMRGTTFFLNVEKKYTVLD